MPSERDTRKSNKRWLQVTTVSFLDVPGQSSDTAGGKHSHLAPSRTHRGDDAFHGHGSDNPSSPPQTYFGGEQVL
jgi:hypothetical protein